MVLCKIKVFENLNIAYCLLPIAYCLLPIPIAYCLLPIAYCLLPFAYCLLLYMRERSTIRYIMESMSVEASARAILDSKLLNGDLTTTRSHPPNVYRQ